MFCFFYIQIIALDYVPRLLAQAPALFEFERRNTLGKASAEALHIQIGIGAGACNRSISIFSEKMHPP